VGRFRPVPAVNVILDSLGVAEETPMAWEQAEEPLPMDTVAVESDYVFRSGDVISVAIFELLQDGVQFVNNYVVTETGKISIPEVGVIEVAGLTETQLEEKIKQILSPGILKNPSVVVTLSGSQQHAFSILGDGVSLPGRYPIPRYDFRLTDALASARGLRQFNVSYIYVSRFEDDKRKIGIDKKKTGYGFVQPRNDGLELRAIEPKPVMPARKIGNKFPSRSQYQWPESKVVMSMSEMATDLESSGMPKALEWPIDSTQSRKDIQPDWESSTRLTAPERKQEQAVSVQDILNTLEERSRREQKWLNEQVDVENAMESLRELARYEKRREGLFNYRDTPASFSLPLAPEINEELVSVRDVLKTLDERSRREQKWLNERVGVENAMESLREAGSEKSPVLQSFGDGARPDGRINRWNTLSSSLTPAVPKRMNEPLAKQEPGHIKWVFQNGNWVPVPVEIGSAEALYSPRPAEEPVKEQPGHIEWTYRNGEWVPVQVGSPKQPEPPKPAEPIEPVRPVIKIEPGNKPAGPFDVPAFPDIEREPGAGTRLIRIPADKLRSGDPRYNIVIKPGDTIHVPVDIVGEFCITGNVNRGGYLPITGRLMTLKMAIAAAGGLGPLAWPKRVEVVRRIGRTKEEIVMVDFDKIASGEQPDFFIKPNDFINVGTHPTSRWRAILRNAFRATYGFGFVYDRNFSDRDFGTRRPFPGWF